jgi:two-component system sensor histidine kinase CreC
MSPVLERKRIEIDRSVVGEVVFHGEEFLVRHAVENILQNAVEFTPAGGTISMKMDASNDNHVVLTVADTGPGIPPYALNKVFERFYSLKRPDTGKKSSGLGLSLVNQIMSLHGGSAAIRNNPSGGAEAILSFPKVPSL